MGVWDGGIAALSSLHGGSPGGQQQQPPSLISLISLSLKKVTPKTYPAATTAAAPALSQRGRDCEEGEEVRARWMR
jgi:hypothetical protein